MKIQLLFIQFFAIASIYGMENSFVAPDYNRWSSPQQQQSRLGNLQIAPSSPAFRDYTSERKAFLKERKQEVAQERAEKEAAKRYLERRQKQHESFEQKKQQEISQERYYNLERLKASQKK